MIVNNKTLMDSIGGLREISEKEMPYKTTLKISKNIRLIEKIIEEYQEEYLKLTDKYLQKDDEGNYITGNTPSTFKIKDGMENEFAEKYKTLNDFENDIDLYMIDEEDLEAISLSPKVLMQIEFMINMD